MWPFTKHRPKGDPLNAARIEQVVSDWGRCLEHTASATFYDTAALPHAKSEIEACLLAAHRVMADETMREHLSASLMFLADYQAQVGPEPISLIPPLPKLSGTSMAEREAVLRSIDAVGARAEKHKAKLTTLEALANADRQRYRRALGSG